MKTKLFTLLLCLSGSFGPGVFRAAADLEVSAGVSIHARSDFYEPLAARGTWVEVGSYGRCWHPAGVSVSWRPYCDGYWEWTDCGWYWQSDKPWAWACYHYGSWVFDPVYGWVWVPGIEWAPAWVCWRMGGDYIGWAPCGPAGYVVEPSVYVFVQSAHFNDPVRPGRVIVNNPAIIRLTTAINNLRREQRQFNGKSQSVFVNTGPRVALVEKATGHKFTAVSVLKADKPAFGSIPKTLIHRTARSAPVENPRPLLPQPSVAPDRRLTSGKNQELPDNLQPKKELPPEKVVPPEPIVPKTPPERTLPPAERELPRKIEPQHPKETLPPVQPVRPPTPTPVVPHGNPVPNEKDHDKDKHNDLVLNLIEFKHHGLAQNRGVIRGDQDG